MKTTPRGIQLPNLLEQRQSPYGCCLPLCPRRALPRTVRPPRGADLPAPGPGTLNYTYELLELLETVLLVKRQSYIHITQQEAAAQVNRMSELGIRRVGSLALGRTLNR